MMCYIINLAHNYLYLWLFTNLINKISLSRWILKSHLNLIFISEQENFIWIYLMCSRSSSGFSIRSFHSLQNLATVAPSTILWSAPIVTWKQNIKRFVFIVLPKISPSAVKLKTFWILVSVSEWCNLVHGSESLIAICIRVLKNSCCSKVKCHV